VEKKERTLYFAALRNGDEENFFGPVVYMNEWTRFLSFGIWIGQQPKMLYSKLLFKEQQRAPPCEGVI